MSSQFNSSFGPIPTDIFGQEPPKFIHSSETVHSSFSEVSDSSTNSNDMIPMDPLFSSQMSSSNEMDLPLVPIGHNSSHYPSTFSFIQLIQMLKAPFQQDPHSDPVVQKNTPVYMNSKPNPPSLENIVRNQHYSAYNFVPLFLYNQFKYFFNLYFLLVALSQFIPALQIGYIFTAVAPLTFVVFITMIKEGYEDYNRYLKDKIANSQVYSKIDANGNVVPVISSKLQVGDIIIVETDQRVPADLILLKTSDPSETSFVRTDQLDGETDWKLRYPISFTQKLSTRKEIAQYSARLDVGAPSKQLYSFQGRFSPYSSNDPEHTLDPSSHSPEPLGPKNTFWANSVVSSGQIIGIVIFTGISTRSAMNQTSKSSSGSKIGILDLELNETAKLLFSTMFVVAMFMNFFSDDPSIIRFFRFLFLFSAIIPISLRLNLDLAKGLAAYRIEKDIPGSIVRSTTHPEELGRIHYVFSDKTGTLTKNSMSFQNLSIGVAGFSVENIPFMKRIFTKFCSKTLEQVPQTQLTGAALGKLVFALALCHNVRISQNGDLQAASADEVALVETSNKIGLKLIEKSLNQITLQDPCNNILIFNILAEFPFSSLKKRMGIILQQTDAKLSPQIKPSEISVNSRYPIMLMMKGADSHMTPLTDSINVSSTGSAPGNVSLSSSSFQSESTFQPNLSGQYDWVAEETDTMARRGFRTLVFASRTLSSQEFSVFRSQWTNALSTLTNRTQEMDRVQSLVEHDLQLIGVTGVEDQLVDNVTETIEALRHAGISVWMLTGDKVETAIQISRSSGLLRNDQKIFRMIANSYEQVEQKVKSLAAELGFSWQYLIREQLPKQKSPFFNIWPSNIKKKRSLISNESKTAVIIDGSTLSLLTRNHELYLTFLFLTAKLSAVICSRSSPSQKAMIVTDIKLVMPNARTLGIGDGGNDVPMIRAADYGVGIQGVEGLQASLAADTSLVDFHHLTNLLLWHGRNSYHRSSQLAQFIIHRGLMIASVQAIYSILLGFIANPVYEGMLTVGYTTVFTNLPVFSIVSDVGAPLSMVLMFPKLYEDSQKGLEFTPKTIILSALKAVYSGFSMYLVAYLLFADDTTDLLVPISFTALIFTELVMVGLAVSTWNKYMVASQTLSVLIYVTSMFLLPSSFPMDTILSFTFVFRVILITFVGVFPMILLKLYQRKFSPPRYQQLL